MLQVVCHCEGDALPKGPEPISSSKRGLLRSLENACSQWHDILKFGDAYDPIKVFLTELRVQSLYFFFIANE
jgi:hypothetical protein